MGVLVAQGLRGKGYFRLWVIGVKGLRAEGRE